MNDAKKWIDRLQLRPHPEGGHFRESYRCTEKIARAHLPPRFGGDRNFSTAIYFLLAGDEFSALHRLKQDEVWHFYDGAALLVHVIEPDGTYTAIRLGRDIAAGELPQAVVRASAFFGSSVSVPGAYALVGCTVAPGFDFADFEMPAREQLIELFPQHRELIERLTRPSRLPQSSSGTSTT
jgi:predicted cupin superfamily sugar epimerase